MKKTVIIYASTHHGNTRKLVEAIAEKYEVDLLDANQQKYADLTAYDYVGFASGIDFRSFYESVEQFLKNNLPLNKNVFFLYTCAKISERFTKSMKEEAIKKDAKILGEYGCKGYNTYGPWKLVGGMNKNHPTKEEIQGAIRFFEMIVE